MALFSRQSVDERRYEYIQSLKKLASTFELILKYSEGTENHKKLLMLADDIRYLLPVEKQAIKDIDKKISNTLGDLKILTHTNRDLYRIDAKIETLDKLIDERNTKI